MARVTYTPVVSNASGKAGDTVFSRWKGRAYIRKLITPANPNTAAQQVVRDSLGRLPSLWRSILGWVRTIQDAYAVNYRMSGYNWFVGANRVLEESYLSGKITPPNVNIASVGPITLTDQGAGSCKVDWTDNGAPAAANIVILARLIEAGEVATAYTRKDGGGTLVSAETATVTLSANKDWLVSVFHDNDTETEAPESVYDSVAMGA